MDDRYSRRAVAALILSPDAMGAALLGAAIELAGYRSAFVPAGESFRDALVRIRPKHVLIDATSSVADDPGACGPALMTGARVYFFGRAKEIERVRAVADGLDAPCIVLPDDLDAVATIMSRRPSPPRTARPRSAGRP